VGIARAFARQLAHPSGAAGRLLGCAMDFANRRPTQRAIRYLDVQTGEAVLDVGCGTGAALARLLDRTSCQVAGIDASPTMIAAARRRLGARAQLQVGAIEDAPFCPAGFDAVLALNVMYFADRQGRFAAALRRQLKPGGRLIAYVTHRDAMERWRFARSGYHRLFDEEELTEALIAGGFARTCISVHSLPIAPGVAGLVAVAFKTEATGCQSSDLRQAKAAHPAG